MPHRSTGITWVCNSPDLRYIIFHEQCFVHASHFAECTYYYTKQPPRDITCDPYGVESSGVSLRCQVITDLPSSSYTVGWFHVPQNSTTATQVLVTSSVRDNISSTASTTTATLTLQPRTDGNSPGHYFCKVLPDDNTKTVPSDGFRLYAAGDAHYLTVADIQCNSEVPRFKKEVKCADSTYSTVSPQTTHTTRSGSDANTSTENSLSMDLLVHYMTVTYVLTPLTFIILIILLIICIAYVVRRCAQPAVSKDHADTEGNKRPMRCKCVSEHLLLCLYYLYFLIQVILWSAKNLLCLTRFLQSFQFPLQIPTHRFAAATKYNSR